MIKTKIKPERRVPILSRKFGPGVFVPEIFWRCAYRILVKERTQKWRIDRYQALRLRYYNNGEVAHSLKLVAEIMHVKSERQMSAIIGEAIWFVGMHSEEFMVRGE